MNNVVKVVGQEGHQDTREGEGRQFCDITQRCTYNLLLETHICVLTSARKNLYIFVMHLVVEILKINI
jgi:hypothetical protein